MAYYVTVKKKDNKTTLNHVTVRVESFTTRVAGEEGAKITALSALDALGAAELEVLGVWFDEGSE